MALLLPFTLVVYVLRFAFSHAERKQEIQAIVAQKESSDLEERVRVLEQIVTDNSPTLAHEIEGLRTLPDPGLTKGKTG
ncbi:MAG: hypothetical protein HKO13_06680 [Sphingomonas sp.]|nr:hypothetical protein [Sphingomonas sp.]